ncbi:MAG: adenosine deaminase [Micrococcales bacterium]|nr:adenosine deaminase [Micrococcales bacterium]
MSDQHVGNDPLTMPGFDETLDAAQRDAQIGSDEGDDMPVTPPDMMPRASEHLMAGQSDAEETIEERLSQEVPDPDSAYGRPDNESGLDEPERIGGDDVDSIAADEDYLGQGISYRNDGDGRSPEESAMHLAPDSRDPQDLEDSAELGESGDEDQE